MSTLIIPDLHGEQVWRELFKTSAWKHHTHVVFLGDYSDSYYRSDKEIIDNVIDIIKLKEEEPNKVKVLMGNHDMQYYTKDRRFRCSGYRSSYFADLHQLFTEHRSKFQLAFAFKEAGANYLCTHAGVTAGWLGGILPVTATAQEVADAINAMWEAEDWDAVSAVSGLRGGHSEYGGPLWADFLEFEDGKQVPGGFSQIVGHTHSCFGKVALNERTGTYVFCSDNLATRKYNPPWCTLITDDGGRVNAFSFGDRF